MEPLAAGTKRNRGLGQDHGASVFAEAQDKFNYHEFGTTPVIEPAFIAPCKQRAKRWVGDTVIKVCQRDPKPLRKNIFAKPGSFWNQPLTNRNKIGIAFGIGKVRWVTAVGVMVKDAPRQAANGCGDVNERCLLYSACRCAQ